MSETPKNDRVGFRLSRRGPWETVSFSERPVLYIEEGAATISTGFTCLDVDTDALRAALASDAFEEVEIRGELSDLVTDYIARHAYCDGSVDPAQRDNLNVLKAWLKEMVVAIDAVRYAEQPSALRIVPEED